MFGFSYTIPCMNFKNLTFSDQLPPFALSQRSKIVSRFGLGVVLSFIVLSVLPFNISFKTPLFNPVLQGLHRFGSRNNSTFPFSSPSNFSPALDGTSACNDSTIVGDSQHPVGLNETLQANGVRSDQSPGFVNSREKDEVFKNDHVVPESQNSKNRSFVVGQEIGRNSSSSYLVDSSENVKNEDKNVYLNSSTCSYKECDIFNGRWVRDDTKPCYPPGSCPYVDKDFHCLLNGRPDDMFVKWKWQPYGCDIPTFNATKFLERLKGKKLVFVGDSLNRNMWESLVCLLRHSIPDKNRVYEISGRSEFKKKGFYAFRFEDYNCSVDFVSSPFFVKESSFNGKNVSFDTLRLDLMDETTAMYHDADVIIFNTGHWWTHEKTSRGENYYQEGNYVHPRLKVMEAYKRALATWAHWVDSNIDERRTQIVFRGFSATHFRGAPWNSGGQCHKETEPIFKKTHLAKYPAKMKVLEHTLQGMKTPVIYLNISRLTDYRKDGHPSIYRPDYQAGQRDTATVHAQDCSHWCLPGVPDTWNELLYVSLLKSGEGSWRD
ncbi:protein trichome birefringence-like 2 [Henckelia pumila]|uniref:protein trichome birefringence-like 2 n=1 Tax=Henckelia pumila TaxID=405737 RepID=UPI003C6E554D